MIAETDTAPDLVAQVAEVSHRPVGELLADLGGGFSTNLLVSGEEQPLVVRIHRPEITVERVAAQQAARVVLAQAGIPVALAQPWFGAGTVGRLGDGRVVEVEPYLLELPHDPDGLQRMDTPERLVIGAGLLARVHDAWRRADLPRAAQVARHANHLESSVTPQLASQGAARMRSWGRDDLSEYADRVVSHLRQVVDLEQSWLAELPRQVVHGDWWDNNVLFDGREPVAVLDLGFLGHRARIDDLAPPIWFHLLRAGAGLPTDDDLDLVAAMVAAYDDQAMHPLSAAERRALPLAVARQPAWSVGHWVLELPEPAAQGHALDASGEFAVAEHVLAHRERWWAALA